MLTVTREKHIVPPLPDRTLRVRPFGLERENAGLLEQYLDSHVWLLTHMRPHDCPSQWRICVGSVPQHAPVLRQALHIPTLCEVSYVVMEAQRFCSFGPCGRTWHTIGVGIHEQSVYWTPMDIETEPWDVLEYYKAARPEVT